MKCAHDYDYDHDDLLNRYTNSSDLFFSLCLK